LEIKRRKFGRKAWKSYLRAALWTTAGLAGVGCAYICGQFLLSSREMSLVHPEQVQVEHNHFVDVASVREIFAADRGQSVLRIPLEERRRQIESIPWVAQATVLRSLPNTLQVDITERTPIAFLRDGSALSLVDIHGVVLQKPIKQDFHFPVVTGIRSDTPIDDREQSMHQFEGFMQGVESAHHGAADQVSEVDLSDDHDVVATLVGLQAGYDGSTYAGVDASAPLLVHFGDGDFQAKYQTLMEKIGEVRAKVGPLESVDLRFDGELVANPDVSAASPQTAAPARSSAAVKAPAAKISASRSTRTTTATTVRVARKSH
jgi:cell division protein FtsQ